MDVCAIIPTYNERENIELLVRTLREVIPGIRLLVVDDGSPDGTASVVRRLGSELGGIELLVRAGKLGFGSAYLDGFRRALADRPAEAFLMLDGDLSHDPRAVPGMTRELEDCDVVVGSRYVPGGRLEGWPFHRRLLSAGGNRYARVVTGMPIRDCTAGFLLLRAEAARRIVAEPMRMTGYAFLMELKFRLWRSGLRIREVPIVFRNRTAGQSKISNGIIREGIVAPWILRAMGREFSSESKRR